MLTPQRHFDQSIQGPAKLSSGPTRSVEGLTLMWRSKREASLPANCCTPRSIKSLTFWSTMPASSERIRQSSLRWRTSRQRCRCLRALLRLSCRAPSTSFARRQRRSAIAAGQCPLSTQPPIFARCTDRSVPRWLSSVQTISPLPTMPRRR